MESQFAMQNPHADGRWFTVWNDIYDLYMPQIGVYGWAVFCALRRHTWGNDTRVTVSQVHLAKKLRISRNTVHEALDELVIKKLIHKVPTPIGKLSLYEFTPRHVLLANSTCFSGEQGVLIQEAGPAHHADTIKTEIQQDPSQGEGDEDSSWGGVSDDLKDLCIEVFGYYRTTFNRPDYLFTYKRKTKCLAALRHLAQRMKAKTGKLDYVKAKDGLLDCIDALNASDLHNARGKFKGKKRYIEFELHLFADETKVDWWLENR